MADRALYLLFIKRELERRGVPDVTELLSEAVYNYGKHKAHGRSFASPREFLNYISNPVSSVVMDAVVLEDTDDRAILRERYCPLYSAWKAAGCSVAEIRQLCQIADWVDKGLVGDSPITVEFGGNMQELGEYCQMTMTPKRADSR